MKRNCLKVPTSCRTVETVWDCAIQTHEIFVAVAAVALTLLTGGPRVQLEMLAMSHITGCCVFTYRVNRFIKSMSSSQTNYTYRSKDFPHSEFFTADGGLLMLLGYLPSKSLPACHRRRIWQPEIT